MKNRENSEKNDSLRTTSKFMSQLLKSLLLNSVIFVPLTTIYMNRKCRRHLKTQRYGTLGIYRQGNLFITLITKIGAAAYETLIMNVLLLNPRNIPARLPGYVTKT